MATIADGQAGFASAGRCNAVGKEVVGVEDLPSGGRETHKVIHDVLVGHRVEGEILVVDRAETQVRRARRGARNEIGHTPIFETFRALAMSPQVVLSEVML